VRYGVIAGRAMQGMLMLFLDNVISWVFPVTLVSVPFLLVNWFRYIKSINDRKNLGEVVFQFEGFPFKSVLAFLCPILFIVLSSSIMTSTIKSQVVEFLSHAGADAVVSVEGNAVDDSKTMIRELQKISTSLGHHSHPEKTIHVTIVSNGRTLRLNLGQDSERSNEYWVFYPQYKHTSMNELGRITTTVFDSYKRTPNQRDAFFPGKYQIERFMAQAA